MTLTTALGAPVAGTSWLVAAGIMAGIRQRTPLPISRRRSAGSVAAGPGWQANKKILQAYASSDGQNAWANIESLGWRKIKTGTADGVTNMFAAFCEAAVNDLRVHAFADGQNVSIMYLA
jgi:immune inhibitor A